jgi:hypothetical protein
MMSNIPKHQVNSSREQGHTPSHSAPCLYLAGEGGPLRLCFAVREAEMCPSSGKEALRRSA